MPPPWEGGSGEAASGSGEAANGSGRRLSDTATGSGDAASGSGDGGSGDTVASPDSGAAEDVHIDQEAPESTASARTTMLSPSSDASTTSAASVELDITVAGRRLDLLLRAEASSPRA